jgi:transketolase
VGWSRYRESVIPSNVRTLVSVEQAARFSWERYVGIDGARIGMRTFGESAPLQKLMKKFGFTVEAVVEAALDQENKAKQ